MGGCISDQAQVLHYSKYLLGLWSSDRKSDITCMWNLTLPYPETPPPTAEKITGASLGKAEGKCELVERDESTAATAVSKSQQPGDVLWVIFYGWRGTRDVHLFISTVSTDLYMCVCLWKNVTFCYFAWKWLWSLVPLWVGINATKKCKFDLFLEQKYPNECKRNAKSSEAVLMPFGFLFTPPRRCHFIHGYNYAESNFIFQVCKYECCEATLSS